jgi:hypothetical protein
VTPNGFSQNESYIGERLLYQRSGEVEIGLTDAIDGADAKRILRTALLGAVVLGVGFLLLAALGSLGGSSSRGSSGGSFFAVLALLLPWAWMALVLLVPRTEVLSDWHLLLDGKAEIAETAYGVVYRALTVDHQIPAMITPRRVRVGPPVRGVRNLLHVAIGKYYSYVSVFAFGRDLYLGWTLWRKQLPLLIVLRWITSLFGADPGYSGMIEMEPIKALREAVHNALRQAIEAAVVGRAIPIAETFGHDLPVEPLAGGNHAPPSMVTVLYRVEVFSVSDHQPLGYAEPGVSYQLVRDDPVDGLVVQDTAGATALLKDRSSVQRS